MTTLTEMKRYMQTQVKFHRDPLTHEVSATLMAEEAADHFRHIDWLDDETHDIWQAAFEVSEEADKDIR